MKPQKSRNFFQSVDNALRGIRTTAYKEKNFRIQIFIAIAVVILCIIFQANTWQFALVAFAIFFVLVTELINTAVESIVDLVCGNKMHPLAKAAKDASAGAVLLAAFFSVIVGAIVAFEIIGRYA